MSKALPVIQNTPAPAEVPLPPLNEAQLDWDELDCVLADLDDFADVLSIVGKEAGAENTPQDVRLSSVLQARDGLVAGSLVALQLRYEFADKTWFDTFLRQETGARLVRMEDTSEGSRH